ncbi:S-layer homology domain-containing protein, partial [Megasphaera elsdenii]|uniref:S-layer homology domain-containing protein n=1 Tax=Megasphaera elsdenii TaxID=907 RepID=UPI003D0743DD
GAGEGAGSISFANDGIKFNNKVTIDNTGKISGVANGIADNDAVNVSQLNKVSAAAKTEVVKGTNIASVVASNATDDGHTVYTVNAKGTSVSVDGNFNLNTTTDDETNVTNYGISLKDSVAIGGTHAVTINGTDGTVTGLTNTTWNKDSITSGRAATEDQLQAVATEAGKHTTLSNGKNTTVKPVTTADGHLEYKVDVNDELKDIKSIIGAGEGAGSISFANDGIKFNNKVTIDNTGKISGVAAGVEKTDAVNVGQLKDYVAANDTHIKSGNYAVGEVTDSTGNKSQGVSMDIVNKEGKVTGTVTITDVAKASDVGDVNNIASDIKNQDGSHTTVVDAVNNLNQKLDNKVGNLNYVEGGKGNYVTNGENTTTSIGKLDQALKDVAATAAKHTTVTQGDNITVTPGTNTDGSKNYNVALKKDITVESVTANTFKADQTVMNKDGLKVGNKVSVSATAVTAGQTSISNDGLKVNGKTYVSDSGLNANYQNITNVADGKVEKGSTDAVNGGQLYNETRVAKDGNFVKKSNTAGENLSALDNQVTANTESIYHMNGRISDLDNRVNKVGAGAAALAALHPLDFDPDAKWDFAAGYGNYRGANAAAVGAYYRPNEDTMFSVGGTFGNGENMVNAGVSFKLGSGSSHVSTSRVAMAKEIKELRGELEAMKSAMLDANAGKKIDTSKLQLFPDVPQNHWAYEYVAQLAGNGMIEGYPDGNFAGDRPMTRYEFAAILYRAMTKGAVLSDKILSEFSHELEYFTVDTIAKDKAGNPTIQRVRTVKENKNK